ncbi:hypothetical protein PSCICN_09040 [Pseudomonas cichorii]|uniref:hypothetical protein n=1 Tax=Pseudomonas cichorii TaxID=36746 RepID=UPI001910B5EB|nr:hypothetical protein [Pseudomonas cichorii]GFM80212.1 hypothetical protein PSCICN_09040 [Pseudomonas cichorii]
MPIYLAAESELHVGQGSVTEAPAQKGTYVVVFEDDGSLVTLIPGPNIHTVLK